MLALVIVGCSSDDGGSKKKTSPGDDSAVIDDTAVDSDTHVDTDDSHDTDTDTEPPSITSLTELGGASCPDPTKRDSIGPFVEVKGPASGDWADRNGGSGPYGVAVADIDGDGVLDVVNPTGKGLEYYRGDASFSLTDISEQLPESTSGLVARSVAVADVEGDGDLDIYMGRGGTRPDYMLINQGAGSWTVRASEQLGLGEPRATSSVAFGDYDLDGDLDLLLSSYSRKYSGILFEKVGTTYAPVWDGLPDKAWKGLTFASAFEDFDLDGRPDILITNDLGTQHPHILLWNTPNGLVADDGTSGLILSMCAMGIGLGDLNGDDVPDIFLSDWRRLRMMESAGPGMPLWFDNATNRGLLVDEDSGRQLPWGVELVDLDNDGDLDAYVGYGRLTHPDIVETQRDGLYVNEGGVFTEQADAWGLSATGVSRGQVFADLNNDGWLDLVKRDLTGRSSLYKSRCGTNAWLRLEVGYGHQNPYGIGTRVRIEHQGTVQNRTLRAGGTSLASSGPPEVHFGLGDVELLEHVEVIWPDGVRTHHYDIPTRQRVRIERTDL